MDKFSVINFCELRCLFPRRLLSKQRNGNKKKRKGERDRADGAGKLKTASMVSKSLLLKSP